jgi:hypothetical protein
MNAMKRFRYLMGASILGFWVSAACSGTSSNGPSGQGGSAGAAEGGEAGSSGSPGKAGSSQQGGGAAGEGAVMPEGGSESTGTGGAPEGGSAGAPPTGPYQAVMGQLCPLKSTIGVVQLTGFPTPYVQAALYDAPDPWIGEPELSTPTCAFHHYTAAGCPACEVGEVCSIEDACVPERRTIKDATLLVTSGADARVYTADPQLGGIYSQVDIGDASASYAMRLGWGDTVVELAAMPVADGSLGNPMVTTEGDYDAPGALDATWEPAQSGAFVTSRIPINHHAAGPTFTECAAPESAGAFHADADMINPLAVVTGLEFQGLQHEFVAAATTPSGCIEFRFGTQIFAFPN